MNGFDAIGPPLSIVVQPLDSQAELLLIGELDMASVAILRNAMDRLTADGHYHVRLNLSGLRFLDAVGVGALIAARRQLAELGGRLTIAGARESPLRVLTVCHLLESLTLHHGPETPSSSPAASQ